MQGQVLGWRAAAATHLGLYSYCGEPFDVPVSGVEEGKRPGKGSESVEMIGHSVRESLLTTD